jgi:MFS family permease
MTILVRSSSLGVLTRDGWLLFGARGVRLFAYGALSVVLVLYLAQLGLEPAQIGLLLTLTLAGDTLLSLWLTTQADRWGRRRVLLCGAALMVLAGLLFLVTRQFSLLVVVATVGVISPSGSEVGPFLAIEQAGLAQTTPDRQRTSIFAWYNLLGSLATAAGALAAGGLAQAVAGWSGEAVVGYRTVLVIYALLGVLLGLLFIRISPAVEARPDHRRQAGDPARWLGLHRSRRIVLQLSALFALDAFAGGFVIQSILAYWFTLRFGAQPVALGAIFFGANLLAGLSALAAARLAARIGLINTMVFTHIPSNLLLMAVPLMPTLPLAAGVFLLRSVISQMDVPTRQSYTMAVVDPDERSAAAGVTGVARTIGAALAPVITGWLFGSAALYSIPFFIAGGLKIVYDLTLYHLFRRVKPPEETAEPSAR